MEGSSSSSVGRQERDLVLPPFTYAYVLDGSSGVVRVHIGPATITPTGNEQLVVWRQGQFAEVPFSQARQTYVRAAEGQYVVLSDPAKDDPERFPTSGATAAAQLDVGKRIVIPGPTSFALWPGQEAQVIDGHHLRHNQYLVIRVYDPEAARENEQRARIATTSSGDGGEEGAVVLELDYTMGALNVIRGEEYSFFVPWTGIEVVPEQSTGVSPGADWSGPFVREAVTLERLDYCVLLDENGDKRISRGPQVVFPKPTESFVIKDGRRIFDVIELNQQSGLYIKAVTAYEHQGEDSVTVMRGGSFIDVPPGQTVNEGDELFLTGADTPIYVPRVEHSIFEYGNRQGGRRKHHAIAIPEGEGRYVLDRTNGEVETVRGPRMFLPDPRTEVIVRRILDPATVGVMYPGNREALAINRQYADEREARARAAGGIPKGAAGDELIGQAALGAATADYLAASPVEGATAQYASVSPAASTFASASATFGGEKMRRGTEYTPPRTITLDTKYEGAVVVEPWPGYAILVMDKRGNRRVVEGPDHVVLEYDESLMVLSLSTGRPKTDRMKLRTPYLRTINNAVSDSVTVETKDLVPVAIDLSLRVNFEGETDAECLRWFNVEDYIALLTDHVRSKLRNLAKRHDIQAFQTETIDLIRAVLLGEPGEGIPRPGLAFAENGMRLYDVEVLGVRIEAENVAELLGRATTRALEGAIRLSEAEQEAERAAEFERLTRERIDEEEITARKRTEVALAEIERRSAESSARVELERAEAEASVALEEITRRDEKANADQKRELTKAMNDVEVSRIVAETTEAVRRTEAFSEKALEAVNRFADVDLLDTLARELGPVARATGTDLDQLIREFLGGKLASLAGNGRLDIRDPLREEGSGAVVPSDRPA